MIFSAQQIINQRFAIRNVLVAYTQCPLTPDLIEEITRVLVEEINTGPIAWAFKQEIDKS
jgi:hypothetical protein